MPAKKEFTSAEEAQQYIEFLRQRNRERAKVFYDTKIKTDPEKYQKYLEKSNRNATKYYHTHKNLTVEV